MYNKQYKWVAAKLARNKESRGDPLFFSTLIGEEKNVKGDKNFSLFVTL